MTDTHQLYMKFTKDQLIDRIQELERSLYNERTARSIAEGHVKLLSGTYTNNNEEEQVSAATGCNTFELRVTRDTQHLPPDQQRRYGVLQVWNPNKWHTSKDWAEKLSVIHGHIPIFVRYDRNPHDRRAVRILIQKEKGVQA